MERDNNLNVAMKWGMLDAGSVSAGGCGAFRTIKSFIEAEALQALAGGWYPLVTV